MEIIQNNLVELVKCTTINTTLLVFLIQEKVISKEFKEELEMETNIKRSDKMYAHLMDKVTLKQFRDFKEGLEYSGGNQKALEILNNSMELNPEQLTPIWFNFKEQTEHFVGREKELERLEGILSLKKKKLVIISGLGGIGKSELVRVFAKQIQKNGDVNCIWLSGENPATLMQSIHKLASLLGLETKERKIEEILSELINLADKKGAWLFVMDNVDELHELVKPTFKLLSKIQTCLIILTSRLRKQIVKEAVLIELRELETPDAELFVQKSLEIEKSEEISKLCELLHNLPLALQQAVAFISEQQVESLEGLSYGIQNYLQEFENQTKDLLGYQIESLSEESERTTLTTWNVTINKIRNLEGNSDGSILILRCLAYLHPDGISVEFLKELLKKFNGLEEKILKSLLLLKSYSLVRIEKREVDIHRILQKVTQIDCIHNGLNKWIIITLSKGSESAIAEPYLKFDLLRQIISIWDHAKKDDELTMILKKNPNNITYRLRDLGLYSQLLQFCKETVERFEKLLPDTDPDVLRMQGRLGYANYRIHEDEEALRILEENYSKMKVNLGEESEDTLNAANNLAIVLKQLKRFDEAEILYISGLDSRKKLSGGKDNKDISTTKHNLALVFVENGKYSRGMELLEEALEWDRNNLGEQHPTTLSTKYQIGMCDYKQGVFFTAIQIWETVLKSQLEVLGEKHPDSLLTKHNLAIAHIKDGQVKIGLQILEELLLLEIQIFGDKHPDTLFTKESIEIYSKAEMDSYSPCIRSSIDFELLKSEDARLETFSLPPGWPVTFISPEDCAKSGFFFLQEEDKVQCAFCRGVLNLWEEGENPLSEHRRHFSKCPFVCNYPPIDHEEIVATKVK